MVQDDFDVFIVLQEAALIAYSHDSELLSPTPDIEGQAAAAGLIA